MDIEKENNQKNAHNSEFKENSATDHQPDSSMAVVSSDNVMREQTGAELIFAERMRQIKEEGWTEEHDDRHQDAELAWAACYYAMPCPKAFRDVIVPPLAMFPDNWDESYAKRRGYYDRVRDLVKAGALIAAEIDRLRREP